MNNPYRNQKLSNESLEKIAEATLEGLRKSAQMDDPNPEVDTMEDNDEERKQALAFFLGIDSDEIEEGYGDVGSFEVGNDEYLVLNDQEADQVAAEDIENSLWAFNAEFLVDWMNLPWEAVDMIKGFQEAKYEDANDTIRALIGDNFEDFVQAAISADGRGHFLSSYDGEENEEGSWFIYRR